MGVMTYPSSERVRPILAEVRSLMDEAGLPLHIISGGGTARRKSLNRWAVHGDAHRLRPARTTAFRVPMRA